MKYQTLLFNSTETVNDLAASGDWNFSSKVAQELERIYAGLDPAIRCEANAFDDFFNGQVTASPSQLASMARSAVSWAYDRGFTVGLRYSRIQQN